MLCRFANCESLFASSPAQVPEMIWCQSCSPRCAGDSPGNWLRVAQKRRIPWAWMLQCPLLGKQPTQVNLMSTWHCTVFFSSCIALPHTGAMQTLECIHCGTHLQHLKAAITQKQAKPWRSSSMHQNHPKPSEIRVVSKLWEWPTLGSLSPRLQPVVIHHGCRPFSLDSTFAAEIMLTSEIFWMIFALRHCGAQQHLSEAGEPTRFAVHVHRPATGPPSFHAHTFSCVFQYTIHQYWTCSFNPSFTWPNSQMGSNKHDQTKGLASILSFSIFQPKSYDQPWSDRICSIFHVSSYVDLKGSMLGPPASATRKQRERFLQSTQGTATLAHLGPSIERWFSLHPQQFLKHHMKQRLTKHTD